MAKRKKYPKLPNGYGSIKYLGSNRRNPYAVHPPTTEFTADGSPVTPKALCYVNDWMIGFAVLTAYKAGTYQPGMEKSFTTARNISSGGDIVRKILADYSIMQNANLKQKGSNVTFADVFDGFWRWKFEQDKSRQYASATLTSTRAAFKNCKALHQRLFAELRHQDLQEVVDACPFKRASKELIVSLLHQLYKYAAIYELCDKDASAHIKINTAEDDEHGVPFSSKELRLLWANQDNETVEFLLIMCYSGYRITAYRDIRINLEEWYFQGGIKTAASKNRIVPIHSAIRNLVRRRMERYEGKILPGSYNSFRYAMTKTLADLGMSRHTPHDCRHTFSWLCEKYDVKENDRKRMLGHSFGADITNAVYGHRTVEELRTEIEKIKACY